MLNIELKSEYILSVYGFLMTNTFLTSILVTIILGVLGIIFYIKRNNQTNFVIVGAKVLIRELLKIIDQVTQDRRISKTLLPLVVTFFLFIVTANLLALIPGFLGSFFISTSLGKISVLRSPNSDLTITLSLAIFSVLAIQFFSIKMLGIMGYVRRFLDFTNPIRFILGFFEMISEGVKIISFSFRLFGNIFAGEVLLLIIAFLIPYIIPLPFMILEIFVGVVQAFIFSMLTLTFIKTSAIRHLKSKA